MEGEGVAEEEGAEDGHRRPLRDARDEVDGLGEEEAAPPRPLPPIQAPFRPYSGFSALTW